MDICNWKVIKLLSIKTKKMKKVLSLVLVFVAVVSFNSCKKANSPEAVAEAYLTHIAKMEFDKAKELVTEDSKGTIDFLAQMAGDEAKKAAEQKVEIKDMKCDVKDDKAVCNCKVKTGDKEEAESLNLVKVNDKWLVEQKKEQPAEQPAETEPVIDEAPVETAPVK